MKKVIFAIVLFSLLKTGLSAEIISLSEARLFALASSRSLAKYELDIKRSLLEERDQLFNMLPSISAEYNASMDYLKNWEFVNPVDTFSTGASFSITQIIFQGGKSFIQKALREIATESTRKDALAEYFNVLDAADNAYYAVLEAAAALEAESSSLQTAVLSLSIAEVRHASGMITYGDYLRALAEKENRENSYNNARRNLSLVTTRFKTLTGINNNDIQLAPVDFSIYDEVLVFLAGIGDDQADFLFAEFWNLIELNNPALSRAAFNNERAELNLTNTKRDMSPTISASLFSTGINYSAESGFRSVSSGGITIRGSIPLDFWVIANRIERSSLARETAAIDYANTQINLQTELRSALLEAFSQAGSVLSSRRTLEYTEKHFEFVMERYRLLQSSVSEMQEASSLLITSRNNLTRAAYSFLRSLSKLRSLATLDDADRLIDILSVRTDRDAYTRTLRTLIEN